MREIAAPLDANGKIISCMVALVKVLRPLARSTSALLERLLVAIELARKFGPTNVIRTLLDLHAARDSVRFVYQGGPLRIAKDGSFQGTSKFLLGIDSLQRLADYVEPSDEVVVDAGAHSGLFSALVKRRNPSCRVVAIEANPALHPVIRANLESYRHWDLVPKAVSDAPGSTTFFVNPEATQTSALSKESAQMFGLGAPTLLSVEATTMDSLAEELSLDHIDLLKLDLQGAEARVLKGAAALLARTRKLLIEMSFYDESPENLLADLRKEFGDPVFVQPVAGGADLYYARR